MLSQKKTGLVVGSFMALWHFLWSFAVVTGFAQALLDWIYWLHFLNNPFQVQPFSIVRSAILIAVTAIIGFVMGWIFATIWNAMRRQG